MAYFDGRGTLLERDLFRGSDGSNYLRSPAMEHLMSEYPSLGSMLRDTSLRKALFGSIRDHIDSGKGTLTNEGFLLALGDMYDRGRLKRYRIDDILRDAFPKGLSGEVKSRYVYRVSEPVSEEVSGGRSEGESESGTTATAESELPSAESPVAS